MTDREKLFHEYAKAALNGMLTNWNVCSTISRLEIVSKSFVIAVDMIEEYERICGRIED
jgi:hypothetical protein